MKGLIVATVTPFNDDGSLNLGMIPDYVSYLKREGADGFFINGTTGELSLLSYEEKLEIARKYLEVAPKETIVGIHENSVERAVQLAREVVNLGAYYIASLPPVYLRPSDKGIIEYYEALSKLGVPVIAYYYPARLGYTIRVEVFEKMAAEGITTGMKFTTSNASEFAKYMTALKGANKDFIMLNGDDWLLLYGLSMGADGAVSGIANISPSLVRSLLTAVSNGDLKKAAEVQAIINEMLLAVEKADYPAAIKEALKYRGVFVGPVRKPLEGNMEAGSLMYGILKRLGL
ncbi:MAG: dihydrodipicolinate synthase family protein [Sulfolobaceae archaeon]|nr:dihydrodipicolinate synthase family protein [Sulfolobales archaeon]